MRERINEATGEFYPFQVTVKRKRKHDVAEMALQFPLALVAFDLLYAHGKDYRQESYRTRRAELKRLIKGEGSIRLVERLVTRSAKELQHFFDEQVDHGLEGIIAKRIDAPYAAGAARNFNWIKLKRTYKGELSDTVDLVIVGYLRGRGMRASLKIGAVLGAVYDPRKDSFETIAKVGSGLSEENWVKLRRLLDKDRVAHRPARVESRIVPDVWVEPRYVVTVLADEITRSDHNVHLRTLAHAKGLKINEYGVFRGTKRLGGATESSFYRLVGVPMMAPELREDRGEIEAAIEGKLPTLINFEDLRGDLHSHTNYSDGRSTLEEMVERAAALGYEYIAITDHSPAARIAHGLDRKRLEKEVEEIERLRTKRGKRRPRILHGAEVDILSDGSLDYPRDVLSQLDVVVASVHSAFRQTRERMTGRLLDAIANPFANVLAHPTTRLIGSREPVDFDFERVVEAAVKNRVALEINGQPYRLDLTDTLARAAKEARALFAINSDAHTASQLQDIRYGVFQARRGWVEAASVINTWTWAKLSRWLGKPMKR